MKRYFPIVIGIAIGLLLAAVFSVRRTAALTGCFTDTNGHLFETFICWMKDNGITVGYGDGTFGPNDYITRGQMAVFMQRIRTLGDTQINTGPNDWQRNGSSFNPYIQYYTNEVRLKTFVAGTYGFQATPDIPSAILDARMYFKSAKICYTIPFGSPATYIDGVQVQHWLYTGSMYQSVVDNTDRSETTATCRTYTFTTPGSLYAGEHASIYLVVHFNAAADAVDIISVTYYLSPSAFHAVTEPDLDRPAVEPADGEDGGAAAP